jgi:Mlc titration factor MtfA (ptsG expression regulator)
MIGSWWRQRRVERALRERAVPDELWLETLRAFPFLTWRPMADLMALREMSSLFLDRKEFTVTGDLVLSDEMAVAVAAQACLPVLHLGLDWYDAFIGIVIHPGEVVAQREWMDDSGVVHEGEEVLSGEAMPGGPVMLSWHDVRMAGSTTELVYNVVIHEFAHVLDMRDGQPADGIPPLGDPALAERWHALMQDEMTALQAAVDRGEDTLIDPYATQGLSEFFPVASEAFFVAPDGLRRRHPALYDMLGRFYRQDPASFRR